MADSIYNIMDDDSPRNRTKIMTRITMADKLIHRAKRTDNGEWVTGGLMKYLHKFYIDCCKSFERFQFEVDPSTICKCIGRADRDNVMIFEHDVIAYVDTRNTGNGCEEVDCVGEVIWDEDTLSFQVTNRLSAESWQIIDGDCKVIGNAFDNPELLGAKMEQRWIPVSEQLPDEPKENPIFEGKKIELYLVTVKGTGRGAEADQCRPCPEHDGWGTGRMVRHCDKRCSWWKHLE